MDSVIIVGTFAFGISSCAMRAGRLALWKHRKFLEGFTMGLMLGPVGVHLASRLPASDQGVLGIQDRECFLRVAMA